MSHEHCKKHDSYNKYDRDKSNRLALSPEMHSWYDALACTVPVFNICVESVSQYPVINNRYEVKLIVRALDAGYGRLISMRLKEGAIVSTDLLEMRTSVHVENTKVFRTCMEWKYKQIRKLWQDYYSMASAVD
ncbi:Hypothetical protein PHPALM_8676 [Phytophthora palmivora]|uniref:Uncharacterized protein n=1 Tax=Phytophthora palmivora TaxID=4796 RepID=A0A2P4Y996_9STRA|nr:Hypothetical protein PHPALM_8676 [Phytophthora palmivora]